MQLSDKTIINSNIKFLGAVYPRGENQFVFDFNGHTIRATTQEGAEALRNEILENVPQAEAPKTEAELKAQWECPDGDDGDEHVSLL